MIRRQTEPLVSELSKPDRQDTGGTVGNFLSEGIIRNPLVNRLPSVTIAALCSSDHDSESDSIDSLSVSLRASQRGLLEIADFSIFRRGPEYGVCS